MLRMILRKIPLLYNLARTMHILLNNIKRYPARVRKGKQIRNKLKQISAINNKRIWYFCVPEHNNLGDYAQYLCIKKWVKDNYDEYECVELPSEPLHYDFCGLMKLLKQIVNPHDIIIFQSGYTSNDYHIDEKVHHKIVAAFKANVVVFFPQTVKYNSYKNAKRAATVYNQHKKLIFLTRDKKSYEIAKKHFTTTKVILFPDIVTSLIGTQHYEYDPQKREGIMFCIRNDSEKLYSDSEVKSAFKDLIADNKTAWCDTTLPKGVHCDKKAIQNYFETFSNFKIVVTDRFHGTIFSLISATPVVVIKTSDHKVAEGAGWFTDIFPDYIKKADSIDEANMLSKELLSTEKRQRLTPVFKQQYYDKLKKLIDELRERYDS